MMQRTKSTHEKGRDSLSLSSVRAPLRWGCFFPDGTPLSTPMIPSTHFPLMETGTERNRGTGRTGWGLPALKAR